MMADGTTRYGFRYGPIEVERTCSLPTGRHVVTVKVGRHRVQVKASPKGRNIHVEQFKVDKDVVDDG